MAAIEVFEIQEPGGETFDGHETYDGITLKWSCKTDGGYADSVELAQALIAGGYVKAPGGQLTPGSPYRARNLKLTTLDTALKFWAVEQRYDNQPIDSDPAQQSEPSRHDPEAPENDTPTLTLISETIQRPSMHDARGAMAVNAAYDLFDPLPELIFVLRTYRYEFNSTVQTEYSDYVGTTNNADVTIAGKAVPERAGVITSAEITGPYFRQVQTPYGSASSTAYYRNSVEFQVLDATMPSTLTLLDPTLPTRAAGELPTFLEFKRADQTPFTYVPHGNIVGNKGFHQLIVDQPVAWSNVADYAVNDRVTYSGARYIAIQASTSAAPKAPSTETAYWRRYATGEGPTVEKVRILLGDVDPTASDELASQPVDSPHWLDNRGQLMTTEQAMAQQYAFFQQTAVAATWSVLPMVS